MCQRFKVDAPPAPGSATPPSSPSSPSSPAPSSSLAGSSLRLSGASLSGEPTKRLISLGDEPSRLGVRGVWPWPWRGVEGGNMSDRLPGPGPGPGSAEALLPTLFEFVASLAADAEGAAGSRRRLLRRCMGSQSLEPSTRGMSK